MNILLKIAQELSELSDQDKEKLKKILIDLVGTDKVFDKMPSGNNGLLGWLMSSYRTGSSVTQSAKMQLVPQLKGHPLFDKFLQNLFSFAKGVSKALNENSSKDELFLHVEKLVEARENLDKIIEGRDYLYNLIANSERFKGELVGKGWMAESLTSRMMNHLKEFSALFDREYYRPVMQDIYGIEQEDPLHYDEEENESYLNEQLLIWMMNQYPYMFGLSTNRNVLFDQLDAIHQFDKETGSNIIKRLGKFLSWAQRSGLGSENGVDEETLEKLNKKREEIYSDLLQIHKLNSPEYPTLKIGKSNPLIPFKNKLIQKKDKDKELDYDMKQLSNLSEDEKNQLAKLNKELIRLNQDGGRLKKSVEKNLIYGKDSEEYKEAFKKYKEVQDKSNQLKRMKDILLLPKKEASLIIKELGL